MNHIGGHLAANSTSRDNNPASLFPIVGIGASAGGLNAFQCFLAALPKEFGFVVVFMQHLSPKDKSLLPELSRKRRPDIDIREISDGLKVLSGKVYLCPSGKKVRIQEESFHVSLPSEDQVHLSLDDFFIALAEEAGERAIAVIFSGAGTDGARGIQAIRNAGGTVFVQEPETAEFPGMPLAAIGTGQSDAVLPPASIAQEILKLRGVFPAGADKDITPTQFETFSRLIHQKTGYRFNHYKKNVVSRRIRRRMYLRGVSSVQDYIEIVAEKDSEAANLASDLMIGVTSFFRDRLAWKALKIEVIRKLAALVNDQPVRVWTPACATGEEAYSIAMILRYEFELVGSKREIQVFATDVNDRAIEKARDGIYPGSIVADVPPDYMKRFFTCSEDGLSVIIGKEIRESVVFAKQDLLSDPPFSRLDLIICRNFLIYLQEEAQEKCIAIFHYALKDDGYLFLGNAESSGKNKMLFKSLGHKKCRIYRKIEAKYPATVSFAVPIASERATAVPSRASADYQQSVNEFVQQALLEESGPVAVAINEHYDIVYNNGLTNRYLCQPRGAPTQNLLELLPGNLSSRVRGALHKAGQEASPISIRAIIPNSNEKKRRVTLRISKLRDNLFLVVFREKCGITEEAKVASLEAAAVDETAICQLENELSATRIDLQSHIEQLKSVNEELHSSNEELQAANEELETSREELQSLNEELVTVNSQLQAKIEEQEETNNDLNNFLSSTNIPTVFLDSQFRVRLFTPAMSKFLKLVPSDMGRSIMDLSQENLGPDLIADAQAVLDSLVPVRKEIVVKGNRYIRATLPYRTSESRIEGVVITYNDVSDLKRAEERTRHLSTFPQLNPTPVIEVDASGTVTFCNPATERILESVGMDKGDIGVFVPMDFDVIFKGWDKKKELSFFREVTVKDRVFGESVYLSPQFDVMRIYGYDITEQKRMQEALQENEERLRLFIEHAPAALVMFDCEMRYLSVSRRWLVDYGLAERNLIGLVHYEVFPEISERWKEVHRRALAGEVIREDNDRFERADGSVQWLRWEVRPWHTAAGEVGGIVIFSEDITERKRAEEEMLVLSALVQSADDAIISKDLNGVVQSWNIGAEKIFGYKAQEAIGRNISFLVPPGHIDEVPDILRRIAQGEHIDHFETARMRKDGTNVPVALTFSAIKDTSGKIIGASKIAHDITERKLAEKKLKEANEHLEAANKDLESFSYSVSHDLRAPLRHMSGFVQLLQKRIVDYPDEKTHSYAATIARAAKKMGMLIDDLLAFSRLGRAEITMRKVRLNALIGGVVREIQDEVKGRDIEWKIDELPTVFGDQSLLRLVLVNLISNAVKFTSTRPRAEIEIGHKEDRDEFIFFIKDNGIGFDMEYVDKLFGVFQRLHTEEEFEGTGIGLANVRRIVTRHGGKTWAEGSLGAGATFYFTLPKTREA